MIAHWTPQQKHWTAIAVSLTLLMAIRVYADNYAWGRSRSSESPKDGRMGAKASVLPRIQGDTTFEVHYSVGELAKQWRLGRKTVRLLVKDEPGELKIRLGVRKAMTRYSVPESVARRVHTRLFNPVG